jgi:TRAP-type mannitol/chloroaromatic compound transport system permease large subunit
VLSSGRCFAHDEARRADRVAANLRGGHGKSRLARVEKLVPSTLRPVLLLLLDVLGEARDGTIAPAQANAVASIAGAIVRVYSSATVEQQITDLQEQVSRLTRRQA